MSSTEGRNATFRSIGASEVMHSLSTITAILFAIVIIVTPALAQGSGGSISGTYPDGPWNGQQIQYSFIGNTVIEELDESTDGFHATRFYKGILTNGTIRFTGKAIMEGDDEQYVSVELWAGQERSNYISPQQSGGFGKTEGFDLSLQIPRNAKSAGFLINLILIDTVYGNKSVSVRGEFSITPTKPSVPSEKSSLHKTILLRVNYISLPEGFDMRVGNYYHIYNQNVEKSVRSLSGYFPAAVTDGFIRFYFQSEGVPVGNASLDIYQPSNPRQFQNLEQFIQSPLNIPLLNYRTDVQVPITLTSGNINLIPNRVMLVDRSHTIVNNRPAFYARYNSEEMPHSFYELYWVDMGQSSALIRLSYGVSELWFESFKEKYPNEQLPDHLDVSYWRGKTLALLKNLELDLVEVPPLSVIATLPFTDGESLTLEDLFGLSNIGILPGPETLLQALLGVLGPGLLAILIGLLGGHLPKYPPLTVGGPGPSEYVLSDGRTYREGQTYTFDGRQHRFKNGEFVPIRDLRDGEIYIDLDGGRKIWIGGQSWYEEDWRRQAATNEEYRQAHEADWAIESTRLNQDLVVAHQQYQAADALNKIQELALRHGMAADGAEDNMYGRAVKLLEQIRNGEQPDFDKIARMRSYIGNRISGFTPGPGEYPPPEKSWWADNGAWSDALVETGRNLSQGKNSDGSTSWIGLAGRLGIGILTKGASEWAFVPMSSTYTMKNAVESGASGLSATVQAILRALVEDMVGRGIGIGISGASGAWKGGMSGGWQGLKSAGSDQLRQAGDLISGKAWKATGQSLANSVSNGSQRFMDIVRLREGYTGPGLQQIKKGAQKGLDQALGRKPQLSAAEQAKLKQFNTAVNSGDPKKVAELYKDGGMKQLSELQKKGVIPPESARKCNSMLKTQVDESIREGTRNAIIETQKKTHVRVKEVIVADSGSSAKGQVTRLPTDADRTLIPEFNKRDLNWYAKSKNMTTAEAYNELSRQLNESHKVQVNRALKKNAGVTAKDVDFGSYDRIGSASGQSDSYPTSFTNARTAVDGASEVTRVSADGTKINKPYKTSGQAAVDANQLKLRKYGTDIFDPDPTRILPADTKPVLKQQIQSIFKGGKSGNPEALAKSVERFHKQATIGQYSTKDGVPDHISVASKNSLKQASERMVSTSRLVRNTGTDPSQLIEIAKQNGYSSVDEFIQECIDFLKYAESEFTAVA